MAIATALLNGRLNTMRYISVLIHNSVPLIGVLIFGWSVFTLLALFWCDALFQALYDMVRIVAHRRLTNDPAHKTGAPDYSGRRFDWVSTPARRGSYLSQHVRAAFPVLAFCGGALVATYFVLLRLGVSPYFDLQDFLGGVASVAVIGAMELIVDLQTIGNRSFLWLQIRAGSVGTSLLVVTILIGIPIAIWFRTLTAAYVVLVLLKILADWGEVMWDGHKARMWPKAWDQNAARS